MTAPDEQMTALRRRFLLEAEADCRICREAHKDGDFELLRRTAHRLAGRGGMFGYPELSKAAGELEEALLASAGSEAVTSLLGKLMALLEVALPKTLPTTNS
jgi:HPt (histidine-containing phosphotransfer) domain-containing protein